MSSHFNNKDISCNDGDETMPTGEYLKNALELQKMLEEFRIWYNRVMHVNSWYRTEAYNKRVGGSPRSQHRYGNAVDIAWTDDYMSADRVRQAQMVKNMQTMWKIICKKHGVGGGFGWYRNFFHLDRREGATLTTWKL